MGKLYDKILDKRNIYAAAYALPGFLKETGLIAAVNEKDLKLYQQLYYFSYCIPDDFIDNCHNWLKELLAEDNKALFKVKVFFKFKKLKADGTPEYRPIHTTDITSLICIQSIANAIF